MSTLINRLSALLGVLSAWLFVVTGLMLCWEVVARYLFNAPTIWAAELSQLLLIWGTFMAAAYLLHNKQHIAITLLTERFGSRGRRFSEAFTLFIIALFSAWIAWHGFAIASESFMRGRSSGTMMNLPNWIAEAAIPLGFAMLTLQALVNLLAVLQQKSSINTVTSHSGTPH